MAVYVCVCVAVACCTTVSDPASARSLGSASIGLSVTGIIITVVVAVILVAIYFTLLNNVVSCAYYTYNRICYRNRDYVGRYRSCAIGVKSSDGYCYWKVLA